MGNLFNSKTASFYYQGFPIDRKINSSYEDNKKTIYGKHR